MGIDQAINFASGLFQANMMAICSVENSQWMNRRFVSVNDFR